MNDHSATALKYSSTPSLRSSLLLRYRLVLGFFIVALVISGLTAFPLAAEMDALTAWLGWAHIGPQRAPDGFAFWLLTVRDGLQAIYAKYPWVAYGTDWLAFAHITIAVFFIGPLMHPVRNVWVLKAGLIACLLVPALALGCGPLRGIPFYWRLIDCSFGLLGALPLLYCLKLTRTLAKLPMARQASPSSWPVNRSRREQHPSDKP